MILDKYILLLGLLVHRFLLPGTGTHDGRLSFGLLRTPTMARKSARNSGLTYAFRVRKPWSQIKEARFRLERSLGEKQTCGWSWRAAQEEFAPRASSTTAVPSALNPNGRSFRLGFSPESKPSRSFRRFGYKRAIRLKPYPYTQVSVATAAEPSASSKCLIFCKGV